MTMVQRSKQGSVATPAEGKAKKRFAFFGEMISEFKKVAWPTRKDLTRLTLIVIIVTSVLGLILGGIDYGFTHLVTLIGGS